MTELTLTEALKELGEGFGGTHPTIRRPSDALAEGWVRSQLSGAVDQIMADPNADVSAIFAAAEQDMIRTMMDRRDTTPNE